MIEIIPSWQEIKQLKTPLTVGEEAFVKRLELLFRDSPRNMKVFVQSNINGDKPDIVVMERGTGIWIIEVKDWNLDHYSVSEKGWILETEKKKPIIKSPFNQAERYRKNFFKLHSFNLAKENLRDNKNYGSIKVAIYFHCEATVNVKVYHDKEISINDNMQFFSAFGNDLIDKQLLEFFKTPKIPIDVEEFDYLLRYLNPSKISKECKSIQYNIEQQKLIKSTPSQKKIKGVAGSGKSIVLAARAVNALERTNKGRILILTFNLTLINYLHDRISDVRGKYKRNDFEILNYHTFINAQCNNFNIVTQDDEGINFYENTKLFSRVANQIEKYDAIFIDEIQDFKYEWQQIIKKYFLKSKGELVIFGDEIQNLYGNVLEDKKMKTVVPGKWSELRTSYRLTAQATELAKNYQREILSKRYEIDYLQLELDLNTGVEGKLHYAFTQDAVSLVSMLMSYIEYHKIQTDDVVFMGNRKSTMRQIDVELRRLGYVTSPTFIDQESYNLISEKVNNNIKLFTLPQKERDKIIRERERELERPLKIGFWMQSGRIKLSTIHSFKGWEANYVFYFLETMDTEENESIDEAIYTALTRCKKDMFIINMNSLRLHGFFEKNKHLFAQFNDAEVPSIYYF